jgi:hypothetical protein
LGKTSSMRICDSLGRNVRLQLSWLVAVLSLLLAGAFYRSEATRLQSISRTPVRLPLPLSAVPMIIGDWEGRDITIPELVQKAAANDDYVCRLYVNKLTGQWAKLYVGFSGRPRTMIGHKPTICYVSAGWVLDSSEQSQIVCRDGSKIPCLFHRFHKSDSSGSEIVVLNFYVVNGQINCDEGAFSGISWRTPNIDGNCAHYVAQIQIISTLEAFAFAAAADLAVKLIDFFPDKQKYAANVAQ